MPANRENNPKTCPKVPTPKRTESVQPEILVRGNKSTVKLGNVAIHIHPAGEGFRLVWSVDGHQQRRRAPSYAQAVADAKEVVLSRVQGRTSVQADKWEYFLACENSCPIPLDVAVRFYKERCPTTFDNVSLPDIVEEYIAVKEKKKGTRRSSIRCVESIKYRYRAVAAGMPKNIHDITEDDIDDFLNDPAHEWAERTKYNMQQSVGLIFAVAKRRRALPSGDSAFDRFLQSESRIEKPIGKEREPLSAGDLRKLLAWTAENRPDFVLYLAIAAFAGVRAQEIGRLQWGDHLDFEEGVLRLTPDVTKTSRRRLIKMSPTLRAWVEWSRGKNEREGKVVPYHSTARFLTEAIRGSGVTRWPHNAFRVSFLSYSMVSTPDTKTIAAGAGHSETMLMTEYLQVSGVSEKKAKEWFDSTPEQVLSLHIPYARPG